MPASSRHRPIAIVHGGGIARAKQLCDLYVYQSAHYPAALDSSDLLRGAIVMAFSSLDLLTHSLYRDEVRHRIAEKRTVKGLRVPFNTIIVSASQVARDVEADIVNSHSYRSFIAPDKIAEVLCHFVDQPWRLISSKLDRSEDAVKGQLKELVRWRNRIAHESDINPTLRGIELWPILEVDVRHALELILRLGYAIISVVEEA